MMKGGAGGIAHHIGEVESSYEEVDVLAGQPQGVETVSYELQHQG